MDIYKNLDDIDYNAMAKEIELLGQKDEKELYKSIGVAIAKEKKADIIANNDLKIDLAKLFSQTSGFGTVEEGFSVTNSPGKYNKSVLETHSKINSTKDDSSKGSKELPAESEEVIGKAYWERFEKNVKKEICSNDIFKNIFANMDSLSQNLKSLTEALLIALGIVVPSIAVISAICVLVALIIKVGYKTYCELEIVAES